MLSACLNVYDSDTKYRINKRELLHVVFSITELKVMSFVTRNLDLTSLSVASQVLD
jgi:hypothetical protein